MKTPIAWLQLRHQKLRSLAALSGVSMAITLIFLQLGFYRAGFTSAVMALDQFEYDIALVSSRYVHTGSAWQFPRPRVFQALADPEVERITPLYVSIGQVIVNRGAKREILIIGIKPTGSPFRLRSINRILGQLTLRDSALVDRKMGPGYDGLETEADVEVNGYKLRIVADYEHGVGFTANAALIVSESTYLRVFDGLSLENVNMGLISLKPEAMPETVAKRLKAILPADVRVLLRSEQHGIDQDFSLNVKPVGIMFTSGLLLAFLVGAIFLYQILSSEIVRHFHEFATLKAIGYSSARLRLIVLQQAALFALLGFAPATLLSSLIFAVISSSTTFPTTMTVAKIVTVFGITIVMCSFSGLAAIRKVDRADPADLF